MRLEAVIPGRTGLLLEDPYDVEELAALLDRAAEVDLAAWGREAAASVDAYRRDRVMARVERDHLLVGMPPAGRHDGEPARVASARHGPLR